MLKYSEAALERSSVALKCCLTAVDVEDDVNVVKDVKAAVGAAVVAVDVATQTGSRLQTLPEGW